MLSIGIWYQPYTVLPTLQGSDFGVLGHLWSQNDVIVSWLRLTATANCFPHPYRTCKKFLGTLICCPYAYGSSLTQLYPPYLAQILEPWFTCGVKMMWFCHGWGWRPPQTASPIHIQHVQSIWAHWCAVHWHTVTALHSYPPYLAQTLWFCVTCGVKMMWLFHGWGWQPPQTASCIHIRHIQSVWAHWYAVHRHIVSALHSFTHPSWLRFLGSGSLVESK
jgi:hypothetical protein